MVPAVVDPHRRRRRRSELRGRRRRRGHVPWRAARRRRHHHTKKQSIDQFNSIQHRHQSKKREETTAPISLSLSLTQSWFGSMDMELGIIPTSSLPLLSPLMATTHPSLSYRVVVFDCFVACWPGPTHALHSLSSFSLYGGVASKDDKTGHRKGVALFASAVAVITDDVMASAVV